MRQVDIQVVDIGKQTLLFIIPLYKQNIDIETL